MNPGAVSMATILFIVGLGVVIGALLLISVLVPNGAEIIGRGRAIVGTRSRSRAMRR